jgi:Ca-activated chloride channel family protein
MQSSDVTRPFIVVFLTDGQPTIGETNSDRIMKNIAGAKTGKARVFCFGIGDKEVNTVLLDRIAEENAGARTYVTGSQDIEVSVSNFYDKIAKPVMSDLKLSFVNIATSDIYPKQLPDVFWGTQLTVFGRYDGDGAKAIQLEGIVNGKKQTLTYEFTFPKTAAANAFVPRIWAQRKIGYLLEQIRLNGETAEVKAEIVKLSKEYGIMTPYTSFLVVEDGAIAPPQASARNGWAAPRADAEGAAEDAMRDRRDLGSSSGAGGVRGSDSVNELKEADKAEAPAASATPGKGGKKQLDENKWGRLDTKAPVKHVESKVFFKQGASWVDREALDAPEKTTTKKLTYLSDEYFELLKSDTRLGKYMAIGDHVTVFWKDTIYVITAAE